MTENQSDSNVSKSSKNAPLIAGLVLLAALASAAYLFLGTKEANHQFIDELTEQTENNGLTPAPIQDQATVEQTQTAQEEFPPMPDTQPATVEAPLEETPVLETSSETAVDATTAPVAQEASATVKQADAKKALSIRAIGDPRAPIRVEEYSSLTCSHCASFHETTYAQYKAKYIDTGKVYHVFNDYPLNKPALDASVTARCLPEEKYETFLNLLFKTQRQWAAEGHEKALRQNAKLAGLSDEDFDACMASQEIKDGLAAKMKEASDKYEINSTPTFVFNDGAEIIRGASSITGFDQVIQKLEKAGAE